MVYDVMVELVSSILAVVLLGIFYLLLRMIGWRAMIWPKQAIRGWFAEDARVARADNPYRPDTPEWKAWDAGWQASRETNP